MLGSQSNVSSNRRQTSRASAQKSAYRTGPGGSLVQLRGIVRVIGTLNDEMRAQSMQLPIQRPPPPLNICPPATTAIAPPATPSTPIPSLSPSPTSCAVSDVRLARTPPGPGSPEDESRGTAQHAPLQATLSTISSPSPTGPGPERNADPQRRYSLAVPAPAGPPAPLRAPASTSGTPQYCDACTDTPDSELNPFLLCDPVCVAVDFQNTYAS